MSDKYFKERGEYLFSDRLEREEEAFRHKMRKGYREIAAKQENTVIIDADNDIKTVRDLVTLSESDLKDLKGFGQKALDEVKEKLTELNI